MGRQLRITLLTIQLRPFDWSFMYVFRWGLAHRFDVFDVFNLSTLDVYVFHWSTLGCQCENIKIARALQFTPTLCPHLNENCFFRHQAKKHGHGHTFIMSIKD